jgi:hypothetical protein
MSASGYADDANLLEDNTDTIKKNTETLIYASKEVCLEINVEESKYMLLSCHQNASQNWDKKIANRLFENVHVLLVVVFKFLNVQICVL